MKARIFAPLIALATASPAAAQQLPNLPQNTVFGRLGIGTGPGQAIPFATLQGNLLIAVTGDVTISASGIATISAGAVTNAKAAQMPANTLKGNNTVSTASAIDLTVAQATTLLGTITNVRSVVFTTSGTYTPHAGMVNVIVEQCGAGGAGGGSAATTGTQVSGGAGGAAGGYAKKIFTAAQIGASQAVTIGAGGVAVSAAAGGAGGATTFGALITTNGGDGGTFVGAGTATGGAGGANGGTASGGDINVQGSAGGDVWSPMQSNSVAFVIGGVGGTSSVAGGTAAQPTTTPGASLVGLAGTLCGGGSGAVASGVAATPRAGGNGGGGLVFITEFSTN